MILHVGRSIVVVFMKKGLLMKNMDVTCVVPLSPGKTSFSVQVNNNNNNSNNISAIPWWY
jgi:hypothetical protein